MLQVKVLAEMDHNPHIPLEQVTNCLIKHGPSTGKNPRHGNVGSM